MRLSVLLNSSESYLVNLPSIASATGVIKSCYDLGTFVLCARLLMGCSSQFSVLIFSSYQDASTPPEVHQPGTLGEWHLWTDCVASLNGVELNGLEAPHELHINSETQHATKSNTEKLNSTCHHCKKPSHYVHNAVKSKKKETEVKTTK